MKFQIASDLHYEFPENQDFLMVNPLVKSADILILAGDIGYMKTCEYEEYLMDLTRYWDMVFTIPGNHEFYDGRVDVNSVYPKYDFRFGRLSILNNQTRIIDGVKFIFSTLWTHVDFEQRFKVENSLNDFKLVKSGNSHLTTEITNDFHKESLEFLMDEVEYDGKVVVVTHHLPSFQAIDPEYRRSTINAGFATELSNIIKFNPQIKVWVHGHSHGSFDTMIGECRVVRNPLGYTQYNENPNFKHDFVIEV